ncbi:nitroreductase family protein [Microbulbifer sp. OS29]|uniref:Nitroreductase family protein n=1 Tax=Microbulbifer okhotskensis TaxID=2926617 RepID=A0A9X2ERQ1_9GAMM|nr:nitroreductase family protein [Microbulbifer okhotskensis]MCO1334506.1 nitroreductase family protein [Microbulbifer okhotskensis]
MSKRQSSWKAPPLAEALQRRTLTLPFYVPLIIVAITHLQEHPKVSYLEQHISTAAAVQAMFAAAYAEGVGIYWRTGPLATNTAAAKGLRLSESKRIDGFVYCGTMERAHREAPNLRLDDFFSHWDVQ